jgi:SAM-dependent methyltransferase
MSPAPPEESHVAASRFWDRESAAPTHVSWMADPLVREYINESISGSPGVWPADWFTHWVSGRRFDTALSIGCGTGPLERDLLKRDLVGRFDAFDGSPGSLDIARQLAKDDGVEHRVDYFLGDFNAPRFPRRKYDIVFFHQSAHHVSKLEKIYSAILRALKPDGLLYLDEYVGPSRFDWNEALLAPQRAFYERLPVEARVFDVLPLPIQADDPSEAIRSSEIVPQLVHGFDVLERRDYGGNLLSVLFPAIRWEAAPPRIVEEMIDEEKRLLASGAESFHAVIVAAPRRWPVRSLARGRYFVAPKLRRLRYELATRIRSEENPRF